MGADGYSTTLLYSRYQNHQLIREKGEELAQKYGIDFYYEDFRQGWQKGIDGAIAMDIYRQPYCGCIYSEQERYDKKLRRRLRGAGNNKTRSRGPKDPKKDASSSEPPAAA